MTNHSTPVLVAPLSPTDLVALPRLGHPARCTCFVCATDLVVADFRNDVEHDAREDGIADWCELLRFENLTDDERNQEAAQAEDGGYLTDWQELGLSSSWRAA